MDPRTSRQAPAQPCEVWLDEERQLVRQRWHAEPDLEHFRRIIRDSRACAQRLRRPDQVRILVDGEWFGRMDRSVRAEAARLLRDPELVRLAVVNRQRVARVVVRFLLAATGTKKLAIFAEEAEAVRWLLS